MGTYWRSFQWFVFGNVIEKVFKSRLYENKLTIIDKVVHVNGVKNQIKWMEVVILPDIDLLQNTLNGPTRRQFIQSITNMLNTAE
jgi:hypothetical protein